MERLSWPVGDYPNMSKYVRVSNLLDTTKTPNYLDENGQVTTPCEFIIIFSISW